ncbi:MAG: hypothetical protein ACE5KM_05570 [Planctomycetaceae bacterium]
MRAKSHVRLLASGLCAAVIFGPSSNAMAAAPDVDKLLQAGDLAAAETALAKHLKANLKDNDARFGLGTVQFLQGIEGLMQALHKFGLREHNEFVPFLRLPAPNNVEPEEIQYSDMRRVYETLHKRLTKSEATLAGITSGDVKMPLHVMLIRFDFNGDGKAEEGEMLWRIFERFSRAGLIGELFAGKLVIAFDRADVHWLRGYSHLLMAFTDFILAHDWKESFEKTAQLFFKNPDSPFAYLRRAAARKSRFNEVDIADVIAFIHLFNFDVKDAKRMKSSLGHLQAMVAQSRECWRHAEAETDNDREWLPNAKQTGLMPGMKVTAEMIKTWKEVLDEADAILAGKKLVPHWRIDDGRGINIRKVFTEPRKFDLVLWVQGAAAKPYLERGKLTDRDFWFRLNRTFGGNFLGFAIWFN